MMFVLPARVARVVAEVTMTSMWIVSSAVWKVMSDLLRWVLSSSGCWWVAIVGCWGGIDDLFMERAVAGDPMYEVD